MEHRSVPASSVLGLKAELHAARPRAQHETRAPPQRARPALRWSDAPRRTHDADAPDDRLAASRSKLARKAHLYAKLQQGRGGHAAHGLVDWDLKDDEDAQDDDDGSGDGDNDGDAQTELPADDPDDPLVEHVDEFGRTRMVRRSDLPRAAPPSDESEPEAIYGPATSFPVYRREPRTLEVRAPRAASPPPEHFDADWEVRTRGAAFYKFDADERVRQAQQRELQALRAETQAQRAERGAAHAPRARRTTLGAARRAARQRVVDAHRAAAR